MVQFLPLPEGASPFPGSSFGNVAQGIGDIFSGAGNAIEGFGEAKKSAQERRIKKKIDEYLKLKNAMVPQAPQNLDAASMLGPGNLSMGGGSPAPSQSPGAQPISQIFQGMPLSLDTFKTARNYLGDKLAGEAFFPKQPTLRQPAQQPIVFQHPDTGQINPGPAPGFLPTPLNIARVVAQQKQQEKTFNFANQKFDTTIDEQHKNHANSINEKYDKSIQALTEAVNTIKGAGSDNQKVIQAVNNLEALGILKKGSADAFQGILGFQRKSTTKQGVNGIVNLLLHRQSDLEKTRRSELKQLNSSYTISKKSMADEYRTKLMMLVQQGTLPEDTDIDAKVQEEFADVEE